MKIQNIMEPYVVKRVNDLYDEFASAKQSFITCDCESCRCDTICYVLNRIPVKYVVSGIGVTHALIDDDAQLRADIDSVIMDGIRIVNTAKRPYHDKRDVNSGNLNSPAFVFPVFHGAVYDGHTFEPLPDTEVALTSDSQLVNMEDCSWSNPLKTASATKCVYSFKPAPVPAEAESITKSFSFMVTLSCPGYHELSFSITVPVTSSSQPQQFFSIKLQDAYLFPEGDVNTMEEI